MIPTAENNYGRTRPSILKVTPTPSTPGDDTMKNARKRSILKVAPTPSTPGDDTMKNARKRSVSFSCVIIQEHELILGDHPDCSYGPPTSLDWNAKFRESLDIDDFEAQRCRATGSCPRRSSQRRLILSYYERRDRIMLSGATETEIKEASKEKQRYKTKRQITRLYAKTPVGKAEELLASATRKFKRAVKISPLPQCSKAARMSLDKDLERGETDASNLGAKTKIKDELHSTTSKSTHVPLLLVDSL